MLLEKSPSPVYGARLELVYGLIAHRGFESLLLRQKKDCPEGRSFFFYTGKKESKFLGKLTRVQEIQREVAGDFLHHKWPENTEKVNKRVK